MREEEKASSIKNYKKCVLIISHDRYFLDQVTNKTLAMEFLRMFIKDIGINCEVKGDLTVDENGFAEFEITGKKILTIKFVG